MMTTLTSVKTSNDGVRAALRDADLWIKDRRKQARKNQSRFAWWGKTRRVLDVAVIVNILWRTFGV